MLVEPGFGKDVRLQPSLSPAPLSPISRVKHASCDPVSPIYKEPSRVKLRLRHSSEPAKGDGKQRQLCNAHPLPVFHMGMPP